MFRKRQLHEQLDAQFDRMINFYVAALDGEKKKAKSKEDEQIQKQLKEKAMQLKKNFVRQHNPEAFGFYTMQSLSKDNIITRVVFKDKRRIKEM